MYTIQLKVAKARQFNKMLHKRAVTHIKRQHLFSRAQDELYKQCRGTDNISITYIG